MAQETKSKTITLKTGDGVTFEVESAIAKEFQSIESLINIKNATSTISIPNVNSREFERIVRYYRQHHHFREAKTTAGTASDFDVEFVKALNYDELNKLMIAADYLNVKNLFDLLCVSIANLIKNDSDEFVKNFFNIINGFERKIHGMHAPPE